MLYLEYISLLNLLLYIVLFYYIYIMIREFLTNNRIQINLVFCGVIVLLFMAHDITNHEVTGELKFFETEDYGSFCGDYPFTLAILKNHTDKEKQYCSGKGRFFFRGYNPDYRNLELNNTYTFYFHSEIDYSHVGNEAYEIYVLDGVKYGK